MKRFLKRLKFVLAATNQHGVHSPFVFDYLTKCLYQKRVDRTSKVHDLLIKSIEYFHYSKLSLSENGFLKGKLQSRFPELRYDDPLFDLIYFDHLEPNSLSGILSEGKVHNNTMILINDIHKNPKTSEQWNLVIKEEKAIVTIDFFYCGAVFFRQEQLKEHFKIRI